MLFLICIFCKKPIIKPKVIITDRSSKILKSNNFANQKRLFVSALQVERVQDILVKQKDGGKKLVLLISGSTFDTTPFCTLYLTLKYLLILNFKISMQFK